VHFQLDAPGLRIGDGLTETHARRRTPVGVMVIKMGNKNRWKGKPGFSWAGCRTATDFDFLRKSKYHRSTDPTNGRIPKADFTRNPYAAKFLVGPRRKGFEERFRFCFSFRCNCEGRGSLDFRTGDKIEVCSCRGGVRGGSARSREWMVGTSSTNPAGIGGRFGQLFYVTGVGSRCDLGFSHVRTAKHTECGVTAFITWIGTIFRDKGGRAAPQFILARLVRIASRILDEE